jgi:hypothetical protein
MRLGKRDVCEYAAFELDNFEEEEQAVAFANQEVSKRGGRQFKRHTWILSNTGDENWRITVWTRTRAASSR